MAITTEVFVKKYVEAILKDEAAIFAGAGLSAGSGMVNWKELLRDFASDLDLDIEKETDLISLAQYYKNRFGGRGSINQTLIDSFANESVPNKNHDILASLPIKTFWTTNYDTLIEDSLKKSGKIPDVKHRPDQLTYSKKSRNAVVYKMHGDVSEPNTAVLTKDDYELFEGKFR